MKIVYFIINDISMPGGTSRVTLNLYNELMKRYSNKYIVKIISASISSKDFNIDKNMINIGLKPPHKLTKLGKIIWYMKFIVKINKFLRFEKPDIVIGIGVLFNLCLSLSVNRRYQLFGAEHSYYGNNNKLIVFVRKLLYKRLDKIISLTKHDKMLYEKFHKNVVSIPNFTNYYDVLQTSNFENKNILFLGRFTKIKGVDILIDLMIEFFKVHVDWKLTIAGEGPLKNEIKNKVFEAKLENNIIMKDPTNNVKKEYLSSSIYLMTSRSEGFPMVLLEAKAFGLPIISFDCLTGPSEIIKDDEDGFLIPIGDKKQYLEKLNLLVEDIKLRKQMGKNAIINLREFHPNNIMNKWEAILDA